MKPAGFCSVMYSCRSGERTWRRKERKERTKDTAVASWRRRSASTGSRWTNVASASGAVVGMAERRWWGYAGQWSGGTARRRDEWSSLWRMSRVSRAVCRVAVVCCVIVARPAYTVEHWWRFARRDYERREFSESEFDVLFSICTEGSETEHRAIETRAPNRGSVAYAGPRASRLLSVFPLSEFSRLRLQYRHENDSRRGDRRLWLPVFVRFPLCHPRVPVPVPVPVVRPFNEKSNTWIQPTSIFRSFVEFEFDFDFDFDRVLTRSDIYIYTVDLYRFFANCAVLLVYCSVFTDRFFVVSANLVEETVKCMMINVWINSECISNTGNWKGSHNNDTTVSGQSCQWLREKKLQGQEGITTIKTYRSRNSVEEKQYLQIERKKERGKDQCTFCD